MNDTTITNYIENELRKKSERALTSMQITNKIMNSLVKLEDKVPESITRPGDIGYYSIITHKNNISVMYSPNGKKYTLGNLGLDYKFSMINPEDIGFTIDCEKNKITRHICVNDVLPYDFNNRLIKIWLNVINNNLYAIAEYENIGRVKLLLENNVDPDYRYWVNLLGMGNKPEDLTKEFIELSKRLNNELSNEIHTLQKIYQALLVNKAKIVKRGKNCYIKAGRKYKYKIPLVLTDIKNKK